MHSNTDSFNKVKTLNCSLFIRSIRLLSSVPVNPTINKENKPRRSPNNKAVIQNPAPIVHANTNGVVSSKVLPKLIPPKNETVIQYSSSIYSPASTITQTINDVHAPTSNNVANTAPTLSPVVTGFIVLLFKS